MQFAPGPIFANIVLADEINRTPPKTQSALLEAMQEHRVTVQGRTYTLDEPFYVFATQNPIELEGTVSSARSAARPLHVPHRHRASAGRREYEVVRTTTADPEPAVRASRERRGSRRVSSGSSPRAGRRVRDAVRARARADDTSEGETGARGGQEVGGVRRERSRRAVPDTRAKARALTSGRYHVSFDDIRALSHPVLRHRVLTNFHAESEGITSDSIIDQLLEAVPTPRSGSRNEKRRSKNE
jgi:MoxR-like ATPase